MHTCRMGCLKVSALGIDGKTGVIALLTIDEQYTVINLLHRQQEAPFGNYTSHRPEMQPYQC